MQCCRSGAALFLSEPEAPFRGAPALTLHLDRKKKLFAVCWIRIRMDPELLPGSGSGIKVPDPESGSSIVNPGLYVLLDSSIE